MLQAMNTGHDGSLTTVHASSPDDAAAADRDDGADGRRRPAARRDARAAAARPSTWSSTSPRQRDGPPGASATWRGGAARPASCGRSIAPAASTSWSTGDAGRAPDHPACSPVAAARIVARDRRACGRLVGRHGGGSSAGASGGPNVRRRRGLPRRVRRAGRARPRRPVARQAVADAADGVPEPIASRLRACGAAVALGTGPADALRSLGENDDVRLLTAAVGLQARHGGDLAALLDGLSELLVERADLRRAAEVATAQARATARMVIGLPVAALARALAARPAGAGHARGLADRVGGAGHVGRPVRARLAADRTAGRGRAVSLVLLGAVLPWPPRSGAGRGPRSALPAARAQRRTVPPLVRIGAPLRGGFRRRGSRAWAWIHGRRSCGPAPLLVFGGSGLAALVLMGGLGGACWRRSGSRASAGCIRMSGCGRPTGGGRTRSSGGRRARST